MITLTADARVKTIPKKNKIPAVANAPYKIRNKARVINKAGNKSHNPDLSRSCMRLIETVMKGIIIISEPRLAISSPIIGKTVQKDKTKCATKAKITKYQNSLRHARVFIIKIFW